MILNGTKHAQTWEEPQQQVQLSKLEVVLPHAGGTLVTCDAIQNWCGPDPFFAPDTFSMFRAQGLIHEANIPTTWLAACQPSRDDFERLLTLEFRHLVTAHGEPLRDVARERIRASVARVFGA